MLRRLMVMAFFGFGVSALQAEEITFADFVYNTGDEIPWEVTFNFDNVANTFTIDFADVSGAGIPYDLVGFGLSTDGSVSMNLADIIASDPSFGACNNAQCNWNGTGVTPEYAWSVGTQGQGSGDIYHGFTTGPIAFTGTATADSVTLVAIRAQSIGDDQDGSIKDYSTNPCSGECTKVPELDASAAPITLGLLASLLAMGIERRRRRGA